jgi:hypothetical protein
VRLDVRFLRFIKRDAFDSPDQFIDIYRFVERADGARRQARDLRTDSASSITQITGRFPAPIVNASLLGSSRLSASRRAANQPVRSFYLS